MLPRKLYDIKKLLEQELNLDDESKELLDVLNLINNDSDIQRILTQRTKKLAFKSFGLAPDYCPTCGKKL